MSPTLQVFAQVPGSPPTTQPSVITITGQNDTGGIPGSQSDPADFYGIVLGLAGIAVAILATRLLFGRGRDRSRSHGRAHPSRSGNGSQHPPNEA